MAKSPSIAEVYKKKQAALTQDPLNKHMRVIQNFIIKEKMYDASTNQSETQPKVTMTQVGYFVDTITTEVWPSVADELDMEKLWDGLIHLTPGRLKYLWALYYNNEWDRLKDEMRELAT